MLRSILLAGTIALSCAGMALPAEAQMRGSMGFNRSGFNGGWFGRGFERESPRFERFEERFESPAFERREPAVESRAFERREDFFEDRRFFRRDRVFFNFGFGGYPYYPYYPAYYYPPYYPYYPYPYYPPYPAYSAPAAYSSTAPAAYSGTVSPSATSAFDRARVREVQDELARQGYDVGPVDGRLGPQTKAAIREYERDNGLPVDGLPSRSLRDHIQSSPAG